jgi:hypothetical protein
LAVKVYTREEWKAEVRRRKAASDVVARQDALAGRRKRRWEGLKSVFNGAIELLAVLGVNSSDPQLRRSSQNVLALNARDALMKHQERQTRALESMANASDRTESISSLAAVGALLDEIQHLAKQDPSQERIALYAELGRFWRLDDESLRYSLAAVHIGNCVRVAEEHQSPTANGSVAYVAGVLMTMANEDQRADDATIVMRTAMGFALNGDWQGSQLDVMVIPGALRADRSGLRDTSLKLLTNPGAEYLTRPAGITVDQENELWSYGYAIRCAEASMPRLPGGNRLFTPVI